MKKRTNKEENAVRYDIENYIEENITLMENQIAKNEELYNDVNEIFQDCKNNSNFSGLRDNINMADTLSKIRSVGIEGADKLLKAKLSILDTENKFRKVKADTENASEKDLILQNIHSILSGNQDLIQSNKSYNTINKMSNEEYNKFLEEKVNNGELKLTNNDKLGLNKFQKNNPKVEDKEEE